MFASSEDYLNESENFGNNNQYKYRLLFRYFLKNKNCSEKKKSFFSDSTKSCFGQYNLKNIIKRWNL